MHVYLDESIHDQHGFMIVGYVLCSKDPQSDLIAVLAKYGVEEFHALEKMDGNREFQKLRDEIRDYVNRHCRWGVLVLPSEAREKVSEELFGVLKRLIETDFDTTANRVFLDEGLVKKKQITELIEASGIEDIRICKSHERKGIQLADLVSALCGVRLREEISQAPKILTYGEESGFEPPIDAELGYELWASLRSSMHRTDQPLGNDMPEMAEFNTGGYGLFISSSCTSALKTSAQKLFGRVYLGCIH